ncbi:MULTISPECIES: hypothetical protein [Streptomyces]|uniref:TetR/AcrR family transcriptional regulator n=1 Tax=Streptomyces spirodelae TaxID=2812904 RepID=A0ABS3X3Q1_9ACTN|nr:hypothetical protein [Streptomyces spirodelae]UNZ21694.1 hypothetical protein HC362_09885 [Streptomyces sp. 891-h]
MSARTSIPRARLVDRAVTRV